MCEYDWGDEDGSRRGESDGVRGVKRADRVVAIVVTMIVVLVSACVWSSMLGCAGPGGKPPECRSVDASKDAALAVVRATWLDAESADAKRATAAVLAAWTIGRVGCLPDVPVTAEDGTRGVVRLTRAERLRVWLSPVMGGEITPEEFDALVHGRGR